MPRSSAGGKVTVPASVSIVALSFGKCFSPSTAAFAMNGRYDRDAPSRALKSFFAFARIFEMFVRSTSTVAVS
jgi:hypothetical protein